MANNPPAPRPGSKLHALWLTAKPLIFSVFAPLITVVGLALSLHSACQARRERSKTKTIADVISMQHDRISKIAEAVSTKYVGTFPNNIQAITKLITNSTNTLWIVTDFPAYGAYSRPEDHLAYRHAIETFISFRDQPGEQRRELRFLCYNKSARDYYTQKQFPTGWWEDLHDQKKILSVDDHRKRDTFSQYYEFRKTSPASDSNQFLAHLEEEDTFFLSMLNQFNADSKTTKKGNDRLPVFLWVSDGREAIFSFLNYGADDREVAFSTDDKDLITVLLDSAQGAFDEAESTRRE